MSAPRPVLASNPLDTKTPSYFELVEMYRDLWALMVQQRERAERAERTLKEIETARANVFPVGYEFANNDVGRIRDDRDALRRFRFWVQGRVAAALAEVKST